MSISTGIRQPDAHLSPRRATRQQRRRLRKIDRLGTRLAELHAIRLLLEEAAVVVSSGWVQGAWFTVADGGRTRAVSAYDIGSVVDHPVSGACLVGAVVQAAGGPATVRSQVVQRTLDLAWHALREDPHRPVRWCPGPSARALQVLELTFWNDAPGRTSGEVADLLRSAARTADVESERGRAELAELAEGSRARV